MANPALDKTFGELPAVTVSADAALQTAAPSPVVSDHEVMTIGGTAAKTGLLLLLVIGAGAWGWTLVDPEAGTSSIPAGLWLLMIGVFVLAIVTAFKPRLAIVTGPIYALSMGVVLGAISHIYDAQFGGIVIQAVMATAAVFIVMLVLFVTRTIRVTNRMRGIVIGATAGLALFYLASIVLAVFGVSVPLIWDTGIMGIAFSVFVVGLAAFNLMLDFDMIERGVIARSPKYMEWYGAFGLTVTIIWMYIEMLRLLGKARS
ncbi:MAG: Bax inhibitor-1/YccA family protein [Acidimicrobiia bacterium]